MHIILVHGLLQIKGCVFIVLTIPRSCLEYVARIYSARYDARHLRLTVWLFLVAGQKKYWGKKATDDVKVQLPVIHQSPYGRYTAHRCTTEESVNANMYRLARTSARLLFITLKTPTPSHRPLVSSLHLPPNSSSHSSGRLAEKTNLLVYFYLSSL